MNKRSAIGIGAAVAVGVIAFAATGSASVAQATGTVHSVTSASKANFSSAVERPVWTFSCNSSTKAWAFAINDLQVIDSSGKPWKNGTSFAGPWSVTYFVTTQAGPVPFSEVSKVHQNKTNGLFTVGVSGKSANAATWCKKGASVSVVGFSGNDEPLLLDGTLG